MTKIEELDLCEHCDGTGIIYRSEWVNDDDNYETSAVCVCRVGDELGE